MTNGGQQMSRHWKTRQPGEVPEQPLDAASRNGANVVAFAPEADKTVARRKKV